MCTVPQVHVYLLLDGCLIHLKFGNSTEVNSFIVNICLWISNDNAVQNFPVSLCQLVLFVPSRFLLYNTRLLRYLTPAIHLPFTNDTVMSSVSIFLDYDPLYLLSRGFATQIGWIDWLIVIEYSLYNGIGLQTSYLTISGLRTHTHPRAFPHGCTHVVGSCIFLYTHKFVI